MDSFVCVRVIQGWGIDLDLFQFDPDLTWHCFFLNSDRTIYGRYGTRSAHLEATRELSLEGFRKALEAVLSLHAAYPGNAKDLQGKTGPPSPWKFAQDLPELKGKAFNKPADGTRGGCIHCHNARIEDPWDLRAAMKPIPDRAVHPYPMPELLGLILDRKECATFTSVLPGSAAETGGFKPGDRIVKLEGQAIISTADIQWVLHMAPEPCTVRAQVDRGGKPAEATLALVEGWRLKDDFTWRVSTWSYRIRLAGLEPFETVGAEDRKALGIPEGAMALRVKSFFPDWVKEKNPGAKVFKIDDVLVEVDGRTDLVRDADYLAYLVQKKKPGETVAVVVLRAGARVPLALSLP